MLCVSGEKTEGEDGDGGSVQPFVYAVLPVMGCVVRVGWLRCGCARVCLGVIVSV